MDQEQGGSGWLKRRRDILLDGIGMRTAEAGALPFTFSFMIWAFWLHDLYDRKIDDHGEAISTGLAKPGACAIF